MARDAATAAGVLLSWLIVVRKDHNVCALEMLGVLMPPFASTTRRTRCRDAQLNQRIDGLLAFGDEDSPFVSNGLADFRKAI